MQEIIYKIDNWTLVKLIGGLAVISTAIISFFSNFFLTKLTQASQHNYNSEIEKIKGAITKNNGLLTSIIQNHLSSSQKILDKKIQAYEHLWTAILKIKEAFPSGIALVYQMLTDHEIEAVNAYHNLNNNSKMGPLLRTYDMDTEVKKIIDNTTSLLEFKPYISDNSFKLFYTYHGLIGRVTHKFILEFKNKKLYNWKQDKILRDLLKVTLTEKELQHIMGIQDIGFSALCELIEYKILQDFRTSLNIKDSTNDTIEYLKDIEALLNKNT